MKRIISLILALVLVCGIIPAASAASAPAVSDNLDSHFYINAGRFYHPIYSNLAYENGQYVRAEAIGSDLVVEYYDQNFKFLSGRTIPMELPVFGGVRMDSDYNFVVVGQDNPDEDDSVEVFRIIRYTKDWKKVDHASLFGANTYIPFDAGSLRFDRSGGILYIRTAHEMYDAGDGLHHQANVMIALRIRDMTITDELTRVLNRSYGYISHSFNQFVRVDGDTLLAVDHGDALPRSVVLIKYGKKAGEEQFYGKVSSVNALPIANSTGHYNDTGVSVGGFECSSTDYLIAGSAYDMSEKVDLMYAHRNIFVTATPKKDFTDEATKINWITNYQESDRVEVSPPHMLKLSSDRFFLTWTENGVQKYCFVNGKGQLDGTIQTGDGDLSDCVPILAGNNAVWYVTDRSAPVFHHLQVVQCDHSYKNYRCIHCGELMPTPFRDVENGSFYHIPVLWALEKGITTGATETTFNPGGDLLRAQFVTFLWRAAGKPEPTSSSNPFTDVTGNDFFYKAVLWAVEKGITNGISETEFGAYQTTNRAQAVTFLWRYLNKPAATASNSFSDVVAGEWYEAPINWAVEKGVTNGMGDGTFGIGNPCSRAHAVTFLYRALAG